MIAVTRHPACGQLTADLDGRCNRCCDFCQRRPAEWVVEPRGERFRVCGWCIP